MNPNRSIIQFVVVSLLICAGGKARAQFLDFSIQDLTLCDVSSTEFEISYSIGVENRDLNPTAPMNVPLRFTVIGPNSTVVDNQAANFEWPMNKHGKCGDTDQGACEAECPKWTLRVVKANEADRLYNYQPSCGNTGDPKCKCGGRAIAPPKPKQKHNGPGQYSVTVAIDPDNTISEINEANNSMTAPLQPSGNVGECEAVPAVSTWGVGVIALVLLTAATMVVKQRSAIG